MAGQRQRLASTGQKLVKCCASAGMGCDQLRSTRLCRRLRTGVGPPDGRHRRKAGRMPVKHCSNTGQNLVKVRIASGSPVQASNAGRMPAKHGWNTGPNTCQTRQNLPWIGAAGKWISHAELQTCMIYLFPAPQIELQKPESSLDRSSGLGWSSTARHPGPSLVKHGLGRSPVKHGR